MNLLAETVRFKRTDMGLSAAKLSKQVGKSSSYIAKVESGSLDPSVRTFAKIAIELQFTASEIAWLVRYLATEEVE